MTTIAAKSNSRRRTKPPKRILILCRAVFGARMSSPGIRAHHMAETLAREVPDARVTLAVPRQSGDLGDTTHLPYDIVKFSQKNMLGLLWSHDLVICNDFPPLSLAAFPWKTYVLDYYTIYYVEWMELSHDGGGGGRAHSAAMAARMKRIGAELISADFLTCANDRQKDYYIGGMIALGLIDPQAYDADPAMHHLIEPVPHGVRDDPHVKKGPPLLKGVYAGIKETDKLIIWNGGIISWYDPLTLLRALARLAEHRDDIKLAFVGGAYPGLGSMGLGSRFNETIELAQELGLYNKSVFFVMSWVSYEKVKDYMLEADLAVCTYFENVETHFSFRTRFVDVFWAELPLICTQGDVLADMVREKNLGITVPEHDDAAVAAAIETLVDDPARYEQTRRNIRENNKTMAWDVAFQPLVEFCRNPTSSALPKWRRSLMLAGAWAQWVMSVARGKLPGA